MSSLISVERAELELGTVRILDGVSLGVPPGARIGVVGRNGGGKSTLLRVLSGGQQLDAGRVTRPAGLTMGMLGQSDDRPAGISVRHALFGDRPDHDWAGDPRIREILSGLLGDLQAGAVGGLTATLDRLSGGELRRVALAGLLAADPDLLLLDEPTNHLDLEAVDWLARHLVRRRTRADSAVVAVTHDRWFLDAVATQTWEVADGRVPSYEGGYAAYVLAKAERARLAAVTAERRDNLLRKELAWLRRGAPARTSKPRFRLDAAAALIADEPPPRDRLALERFAASRLGKDVIDLFDATLTVSGWSVLDRVTWQLAPGDRIGVLGPNGAGKSTLVRALLGEQAMTSGRRRVGRTVVTAHLSQDVRELDPLGALTVVGAVADVRQHTRIGDREISASQLAQRLGFTGARQQVRVGDLSGGERRRLQLTRLLMREPNVLVLDEPTNDLDIETLTAVEDVLDGWPGTLLVVSHDRYLLERMCDRQVALLGDGRLRDLPGGVEQYLRLRAADSAVGATSGTATPATGNAATATPATGNAANTANPANPAAARPAAANEGSARVRAVRKEMARIERQLGRLAEREDRLHDDLVQVASDHLAVAELDAQLRSLSTEREELEAAWLAAAEEVE